MENSAPEPTTAQAPPEAPGRALLRTLYLAAYAATVLCLFGVLPPLAGGLPGGSLAYGALTDPDAAARSAALAAPLLALALGLAAPASALGRTGALLLVALLLTVLGPLLPQPPASLTLRVVFGALLLVPLVLLRERTPRTPNHAPLSSSLAAPLSAGAGVAFAFYVLYDRLDHFGYGSAHETHARTIVVLVIATIGALAFVVPFFEARPRAATAEEAGKTTSRAAAFGAGGALVAALGVVLGLMTLAGLTTHQDLDDYMRSSLPILWPLGMDLSHIGQLDGTAKLTMVGTYAAACGLGITLVAWPRRKQLAFFVLGAGIARYLIPEFFARTELVQIATEPGEAVLPELVVTGLYLVTAAALMGALAVWRDAAGKRRRPLATPVLVLLAAGAAFLPHASFATDAVATAPWRRFEAQPAYLADTAYGLVAVETHATGTPLLVVDGLTFTPPPSAIEADVRAFRRSLDLLAANHQPDDPDPRVLLVGQLTQPRLYAFWDWRDATGLDAELIWTAPWTDLLEDLEPLLPTVWRTPALDFEAARDELGSGRIDLVIVPEALGREVVGLSAESPPRAGGPRVGLPFGGPGAEQPAVVWMSANAGLAGADLGQAIVLEGSDLERLAVGVLQGLDELPGELVLDPGPAAGSAGLIEHMHDVLAEDRLAAERAAFFDRLAEGRAEGDRAFLAAFARLMHIQEKTSPWVAPLQRFELDAELLAELTAATHTPPTPLERRVWELVAQSLVAKRMPGELFANVPTLLERSGRWPELEYALARAYLEMLMTDDALELMDRLFAEGQLAEQGPIALVEYGDALGQEGRYAEALAAFVAAAELVPGEHQIARRVATYGVRAEAPGAVAQVEALLAEHPEDLELQVFLGAGPYPAPKPGFDPLPLGGGHMDH